MHCPYFCQHHPLTLITSEQCSQFQARLEADISKTYLKVLTGYAKISVWVEGRCKVLPIKEKAGAGTGPLPSAVCQQRARLGRLLGTRTAPACWNYPVSGFLGYS